MSSQSKAHSLIEALTNTAVGFIISAVIQYLVFRYYGIHLDPISNFTIIMTFTVASVIRSYIIRRIFNSIRGDNNE